MNTTIFILIICGLNLINGQNLEINNKCIYTLGKNIFTCDKLENYTRDIDKFLTEDTHILIIKNMKRLHLNAGHHNATNFENIVRYDILNTSELIIEPYSFHGLINLAYMKINDNNWKQLKNNTFYGLTNLELLNLDNNNIEIIEMDAFNNLINLISLDLTQNKLIKIPSLIFQHLNKLDNLFLENNFIKTIENNAFYGLNKLITLDLSYNSIDKFDTEIFNDLNILGKLYLAYNDIEILNGTLELKHLTFINLRYNNLKTISSDFFRNSPNLFSIDLSNNESLDFLPDVLINLKSLRFLNISNCRVNITQLYLAKLNDTVNIVV